MKDKLLPALVAMGGVGLWALAAAQMPVVLLPSPLEVVQVVFAQAGPLAQATALTAMSALLGLLLASFFASVAAVAFLYSRTAELAFYPYALLIQTVPIVAIAPLLVVWLGYGVPVAVVSAAIVAFFPLLTAGHMGLRATEGAGLELFALHRASRWQELRLLRLPAALPFLFAGLRTATGLSVIGAIVGEFVGSNGLPPSLGFLVLRSARTAETPMAFAAVGCATSLALVYFGLVRWAERRMIGAWHGSGA